MCATTTEREDPHIETKACTMSHFRQPSWQCSRICRHFPQRGPPSCRIRGLWAKCGHVTTSRPPRSLIALNPSPEKLSQAKMSTAAGIVNLSAKYVTRAGSGCSHCLIVSIATTITGMIAKSTLGSTVPWTVGFSRQIARAYVALTAGKLTIDGIMPKKTDVKPGDKFVITHEAKIRKESMK
jgi:hypothetical protein